MQPIDGQPKILHVIAAVLDRISTWVPLGEPTPSKGTHIETG
jgi:hypothetical protein